MARGGGYNKYNSSRGGGSTRGGSTRGNNPRGRGTRGRARGGRGGGGGRGGYTGYNPSDDTDFVLQTYNNNYDTGRYSSAPSTPQGRGRDRGRGLGSNNSPQSNTNHQAKRNRGRGRGRDGYDSPRNDRVSNNSDAPLSLSLRPLLRPVVFVPAIQNRFLFQAEEELIQPIVEEAGDEEQSHIPTADRVARLFSGTYQHQEVDDSNTEGLEEIDFSDVGRFQQVMDNFASGAAAAAVGKGDLEEIVEREEGFTRSTNYLREETATSVKESLDTVMAEYDGSSQFPRNVEMLASTSPSITAGDEDAELAQVSSSIQSIAIQDEPRARKEEDKQFQKLAQQENATFFIDVSPSSPTMQTPIITNRVNGPGLGAPSISDDDGDIVVYVAPHPRQGRSTAPTPTPGFQPGIRTTSILIGLPIGTAVPAVGPAPTLDSITFTSFGSGVESQSADRSGLPRLSIPHAHDPSRKDRERTNNSDHTKPPVFTSNSPTPAKIKSRQRGQWAAKQGQRGGGAFSYSRHPSSSSFASRGADVSEAQLINWRQSRQEQQRNWNPYANKASTSLYSDGNTHVNTNTTPYANMNLYSPENPYANTNSYSPANPYANTNPYSPSNTYANANAYMNWSPSAYWGHEEDNTQSPKVDSTGLLGVLASAQARVQTRTGDELSPDGGEGKDQGSNGDGLGEAGRTKEEEGGGAEQSEGLWHPIGASLGAAEGMEIDSELDIDMETMKRFVEGMGPSGSRHVTMDDLEDERRIREEDEEKRNEGDEESEEDDEEEEEEEEERDRSIDHGNGQVENGQIHLETQVHQNVEVQIQESQVQEVRIFSDAQVPKDVLSLEQAQGSEDVPSQVEVPEVQVPEDGQMQLQVQMLDVESLVDVPKDDQAKVQIVDDEDKDRDDHDDDEVEQILDLEERLLIAESEGSEIEIDSEDDEDVENDDDGEDEDEDVDVDEDEDDDDDDDQSPRSSFQARLEHLRKRASSETGATSAKSKGKAKAKASLYDDSDSEDEDDWDRNRTWAEADDDFIAQPQDILDENEDILVGREKKSKKQVFQAVYNGDFEDVDMGKPARKAKDKHKDIPPDLVDLWNKDRAKKAIRKQERELARLAATADPLTKKRGGKKGRKAMLAAAKLDPTIVVLPNRVIDMTTLVQQIRRFIDDIGGPSTMSLPPANNQTRKNIHELAAALNLKSFSKGSGDARYTTLAKTTMSGIRVNQKKVAKIVRRGGGLADNAEFVGGADMWKKHAERGKASKSTPKHREGDEVGKAAPKINETNIGFKMLASMGWTEGDPIGQSGGLQNPLTAVIKNTKLGLGAMK